MGITLQELFWTTHLDTNRHPLILGLLLVLWTPIGCILVVIRTLGIIALMFALVAMHLVNPSAKLPSFLRRAIMLFIGIKVKIEGLENITPLQKTGEKFIIVCNHRTAFDLLPLFSVYAPLAVMLDATFFDTHFLSRLFLKAFAPYLHYMKVEALNGEEQSEQREQQRNRLVEDLKQCGKPLCYFPEGWDTNGKGLLVYQRYMFSVVEHIVPCALRVSVPFAPIRPGMLGSSIFREIMWLLFSPCYSYHMCILPAIHRGKDSPTEFANRCQRLTALALGIPATPYSKKDALTYRRTLLHPKQD